MDQKSSSQKLSYYPNLLVCIYTYKGQADKVISQNNWRRKDLEEYIEFMTDKANLEEQYCKGLHKLSLTFDRMTYSYIQSSFSSFKDALQRQMKAKIAQQDSYVELIRTHLIAQCQKLLEEQNQVAKKIIEEMRCIDWDMQDKQDDLSNAKLDYKIAAREVEQSSILDIYYHYSKDISDEKLDKQCAKTQSLEQTAFDLEKEYQTQIISYNELYDVFRTKMESYLQQFEVQEQARLLNEKDVLNKLLFAEIQFHKESLQETEHIYGQVRSFNIQDNIEQFILNNQRSVDLPQEQHYTHFKSVLSQSLMMIKEKHYSSNILNIRARQDEFQIQLEELLEKNILPEESSEQISDIISIIYRQMLSHLITLWNGEESLISDKVHQLIQADSLNRLLWCIALENLSNNAKYHIQTDKAYQQILNEVLFVIQTAGQTLDATSGRKILFLSSLLYVQANGKKYFLSNNLKHVKLFTSGDFIEAAIVESIFDAISSNISQELDLEDQILKQKTQLYTALSSTLFTLLIYNSKSLIRVYAESYLRISEIVGEAQKRLLDQIDSYE